MVLSEFIIQIAIIFWPLSQYTSSIKLKSFSYTLFLVYSQVAWNLSHVAWNYSYVAWNYSYVAWNYSYVAQKKKSRHPKKQIL